jgi:hypothetical protein
MSSQMQCPLGLHTLRCLRQKNSKNIINNFWDESLFTFRVVPFCCKLDQQLDPLKMLTKDCLTTTTTTNKFCYSFHLKCKCVFFNFHFLKKMFCVESKIFGDIIINYGGDLLSLFATERRKCLKYKRED